MNLGTVTIGLLRQISCDFSVIVSVTVIIFAVLSEQKRYCDGRRHTVTLCVCLSALVSAANVMCCIQYSLAKILVTVIVSVISKVERMMLNYRRSSATAKKEGVSNTLR